MEQQLIHNGYNLERRKLYPKNPRNNMKSIVNFQWKDSLQDQNLLVTARLKNQKVRQKEQIRNHYQHLVDKLIDEEKRSNKSSFRVMPLSKNSTYKNIESTTHEAVMLSARKSVNLDKFQQQAFNTISYREEPSARRQGLSHRYSTSQEILAPVESKNSKQNQLKDSKMLSKVVFGYELNPQTFKRESYLSKVLNDRLSPYLQQSVEQRHRRHRSVMTNQIIDLNY